jgi:CheY-like chemotaxis protein
MIDLNTAAVAAIAGHRSLFEHIRMEFRPSLEPVSIEVSREDVERIVSCLIRAGADAMPGGGTLYLNASRIAVRDYFAALCLSVPMGDYVVLAVTDTGEAGTCVGGNLEAARAMAARCGGAISEHRSPGIGSVVRVLFPAGEKARVPFPWSLEDSARGTETILLVEDEPAVRSYLAGILTDSGYTVVSAANGEEAIRTAALQDEIDLLITDMSMPGSSGAEVIAAIRAARPDIAVLRMSGHSSRPSDEADVVLEKPFRPAVLLQRVRTLLDFPRSRPDVAEQAQNPPSRPCEEDRGAAGPATK